MSEQERERERKRKRVHKELRAKSLRVHRIETGIGKQKGKEMRGKK
jgi:hypothetical protein